ncbi:MAG: phenylacetate-CoA oxygenase subunit PaaC [Ilumatobacter sp.]|nr:phenylacetate-CoA oxygenase subunit PaaC [Ilumatobacter sp.]
MTYSAAVRDYLLAFADDEHLVGARHTSWIGLGPFLEEDLAFCSIAQDELGHAIGLYGLLLADVGELDTFALLRASQDYRSCWLAEIECRDWNDSLVRHWLYDRAEALRWEALAASPDADIAALAARAQREESFHLAHADQFMSRVAANDTSGRIVDSIRRLAPVAAGIWDATAAESDVLAEGFVTDSSADLAARWNDQIRADIARWGLAAEWSDAGVVAAQQHRTQRSEGFDAFHDDLQRVLSLDTAATW